MFDAPPPTIAHGAHGTPVPDNVRVMRLSNEPADMNDAAREASARGEPVAQFFVDQGELSVWVEGVTTPARAWALTGSKEEMRWLLWLPVVRVRLICGDEIPKQRQASPYLEVVWSTAERRVDGVWVPDDRPGHQGHASILNIDKASSQQRYQIRYRLAKLAAESGVQILTSSDFAAFRSAL